MLRAIDNFLDRITMYRLVLYYLIGLLLGAAVLGAVGAMHIDPAALIISVAVLVGSTWALNHIFAYIFSAPVNSESSLITALILALIITPDISKLGILFLLAASGLAVASKYVLAIHRKHIFNPAAIAVALTAFGPQQTASWWVGTTVMLPLVIIGGVLVVRKVRRVAMVTSFLLVTTIFTAVLAAQSHLSVATALQNMLLSSAVCFLGFVMLTEPLTSPVTRNWQMWYGALVGALVPPQVHILGWYTSPEAALLIGNVFAYVVGPKVRLSPVLKQKVQIAANTMDFILDPGAKLAYRPGQYMEFTLPHNGVDDRGVRRYFTLASSPTEPDLHLGIKFYEPSSSYKRAMMHMDDTTQFAAAQVAGDFVLPRNRNQKLAFIAGGIGVTPFRSMVKYLLDTNDQRSVVMLYSARSQDDVAYKPIFEAARRDFGIQTTYVLSDDQSSNTSAHTITGRQIDGALIQQLVPDYAERMFYISGTHAMVRAMEEHLRALGVPKRRIKTDFFPGYV